MRTWDNKEVPGRGMRYCLVVDPEDGTHPIRTYGWSESEVLDKLARSVETAQQVINRQRQTPAQPATTARPAQTAPPAVKPVTSEELLTATADLNNPAKSAQAVKTLLRASGLDVDKQKLDADIRRAADVAQQWQNGTPDFPGDPRNERAVMDRALLLVNGDWSKITASTFQNAYDYLRSYGMLFDPEPANLEPPTPPDATNGNSVPAGRPMRSATGVRRTALSGGAPPSNTKPKWTRADIDAMTGPQYEQALRNPEFAAWVQSEFSPRATA